MVLSAMGLKVSAFREAVYWPKLEISTGVQLWGVGRVWLRSPARALAVKRAVATLSSCEGLGLKP